MTGIALFQICVFFVVLIGASIPLGRYIVLIYSNQPTFLDTICVPIEKFIYRICLIKTDSEMNWVQYLTAMLAFNLVGLLILYLLLRCQSILPLNPQHFVDVAPDLAFNTASSFITNTNWQAYAGESTFSYFSQMVAITPQNFLSAASGMAILMAFIRGLTRQQNSGLGNFWVDTVRGVLYLFLPLSCILAIALTSQGVIQNFKPYEKISLIQPFEMKQSVHGEYTDAIKITEQVIPMGPVASQIAIKQLGTNGGGFFNTNSAHPFENPTPISNFLELLAILLIPTASCISFGLMVKDKKQGIAILVAMFVLFTPFLSLTVNTEQLGNPALKKLNVDLTHSDLAPGGNMEGKELRFGNTASSLWAISTTATSNGSVNSMHDSYLPLSGFAMLWMMQLGEVVFGGIGSGLSGMLILVILTVFVAGLMVGRTPEYLGKKITPYEMKMACIAVLIMPFLVLAFTAISCVITAGTSSISNPGSHGFTQLLYAFSSMANNNGSAFAGLNANTPFFNLLGSLAMLIGRFWIAIPTLAIAGALANKKSVPNSAGTLPTHTMLFIILLLCITALIGALSFLPALALGPIIEQLNLWGQHGI